MAGATAAVIALSGERSQALRWPWLLLSLVLVGNLGAWLGSGLLPDEAYYWVWSERLQGGYFDHPGLVAWLIRPFTELFGDVVWAIRLPAVLSWLVGAILAYDLARRIYGDPLAARMALLVWVSLPLTQAGFHIVTPDAPMMIFSWLAIYLACRAALEGREVMWLAAGVAVGLAMWGKYPALLVALGMLFALPLSVQGRQLLRTPWPWLAAVAALGAFMPVVRWNWQHDWVSFAFQLHHGVKTTIEVNPLEMAMLFIGGQMAVVMPWSWVAMVVAGWCRPYAVPPLVYHLLLLAFALPLLVFGAAALTSEGHANWPATAYITGSVLLGGALARWLYPVAGPRRWAVALVIALFLLPTLLLNLLRFPHWLQYLELDLPPQRTQFSQSFGWQQVRDEMMSHLAQQQAQHPLAEGCVVIGDKLQTASMLAFLLQDSLRVTAAADSRISQYTLWEQAKPFAADAFCLFVEQYDEERDIREQADLLHQGRWQRRALLRVENPDRSQRWYGFFLPQSDHADHADHE
ncbi:MAG: glycosyltransferase family 39 protein [Gammaproteobacteria bacterium]|nr:glycosyltransferase family 39 protein [Gammaproteobacteria bacterium]